MLKKWIYYASLTLIVAFIASGFKPLDRGDLSWFYFTDGDRLGGNFPSEDQSDYPLSNSTLLATGRTFVGYKESLAYKESQGQYKLVNRYGFMGKYQFGTSALQSIGITDRSSFLKDPVLQEKAFSALCAKNKWLLRDEIMAYEGKIVGGVRITESGMLAAAHLVGAGAVKKYLRSNGKRRIVDGFGTSLRSYLKRYGGYDTSHIVPQENPVIR
ncbi:MULTISPECIES: peptidoglycan-binding protein LysM [unclassified Flavobacterium]|uniref:peptidoglycan-binding protein LysM n=1 Tax=unclassified Flavobacterium TaxID=196869 RepID=UPI001F141629|nr:MULTISPECIES: peptidoglycan-binding protein LysM [unclassified Flavobacterium]UMY65798.1 peptidoglycan-binding protein LysM [Flavobacterium sp. HJ-32-4]